MALNNKYLVTLPDEERMKAVLQELIAVLMQAEGHCEGNEEGLTTPTNRRILSIDTETTGLSKRDEVISIHICDVQRETIMSKFYRPSCPIRKEAKAVHGIGMSKLIAMGAGPFTVYDCLDLEDIFARSVLIGWNLNFDIRLLHQTAEIIGYTKVGNMFDDVTTIDLMPYFAAYIGNKNAKGTGFSNVKLADAVVRVGTSERYDSEFHAADEDCHKVLDVLAFMLERVEEFME